MADSLGSLGHLPLSRIHSRRCVPMVLSVANRSQLMGQSDQHAMVRLFELSPELLFQRLTCDTGLSSPSVLASRSEKSLPHPRKISPKISSSSSKTSRRRLASRTSRSTLPAKVMLAATYHTFPLPCWTRMTRLTTTSAVCETPRPSRIKSYI